MRRHNLPPVSRPIDPDTRNAFDCFFLVLAGGALLWWAGYAIVDAFCGGCL